MSTNVVLADVDPTWLLLAGIALITSALLRFTYRRRGGGNRRAVDRPSCAASTAGASQHEILRRLEDKEVELHDVVREATARLDNKIAILQRLLVESETAATRLERLLVTADQSASERENH